MPLSKRVRDYFIKALLGKASVPRGLFELNQYFLHNEPINFKHQKGQSGEIIAISENFRFGSIVTSGKTKEQLDENIKDAILTTFDVPYSFAKEAGIHKVSDQQE